jgi:probable rRNA maturation factor
MPVRFAQYNNSNFKMEKPILTSKWVNAVAKIFKKEVENIQYVFCTDEELLAINKQFLNHDYYTDIITFDYSQAKNVAGDIYISIDRIAENAKKNKVDFSNEFHRVLIHGVLHLCGLKDKSSGESKKMRLNEDKALKMRSITLSKTDFILKQ